MDKLRLYAVLLVLLISLVPVNAEESGQNSEEDQQITLLSDGGDFTSSSSIPDRLFSVISPKEKDLNAEGSFQTHLFSGAAVYSYTIETPPGTNGLKPAISLTYNSFNAKRKSAFLGSGWGISQSYIQRDTNYTVSDTSDDFFRLVLGGQSYDLAYSQTDQRYHTSTESYLFIKKEGNNWIVKSKDGTTYKFDYVINSNQQGYTWRWYLTEIKDTHDNTIYFSYMEIPYPNDIGAVYPHKIEYSNDRTRTIEFVYESSDRPDLWVIYSDGHKLTYSRRLKEILVKAEGKLVRKYVLEYNSEFSPAYNFIRRIILYGSDGETALKPTEFEYNLLNKEWTKDENLIPLEFTKDIRYRAEGGGWDIRYNVDQVVRFGDFNRDGLVDMIKSRPDADGDTFVNTGTNWVSTGIRFKSSNKIQFYDVNGDGYADLVYPECVYINNNGQSFSEECIPKNEKDILIDVNGDAIADKLSTESGCTLFIKKGDQFVQDSSWNVPCSLFSGDKFYLTRRADINGDGLIDLLSGKDIYLNNGHGWVKDDSWVFPDDFNEADLSEIPTTGDCKLFFIRKGSFWFSRSKIKSCYLILDYSFSEYSSWLRVTPSEDDTFGVFTKGNTFKFNREENRWDLYSQYGLPADFNNPKMRLADINGDGLPDIISGADIFLNNGRGWVKDNNWKSPEDFNEEEGNVQLKRLVDINGDGLADIVYSNNHYFYGNDGLPHGRPDYKRVWINGASDAYLLKRVTNSLDGSTSINYIKSTSLDNNELGFNIWVVDTMTHDNGMNNEHKISSTSSYDYSGGLYDYEDREFRGFSYVEETRPDGSKIKHWFYQDDAKKGLEYKTEVLDNNGNPYRKTDNEFSSEQVNEYYIITLDSAKDYLYDGVIDNPMITQTDFDYDSYGNIIKTSYIGDTSIGGDERYGYTQYLYDTGKWIVDRPEKSYLLDYDDSTKVSESYYTYNEFGDLKTSEFWFDDGENPVVEYSYNSYGNIVSETDPNGHITQYEYDPTYTFVVKGINAKNQETTYEYDSGTGNLLSITDPNGYKTEYRYDVFGRIVKEILPYDSEGSPTVEYVYDFNGIAPENMIVKEKENLQGTLDSYSFYDGFGNLIQSKSESEDSQLITNDFYYDELLRVKKEGNPYYSGEGYTAPDSSILKTTYEFDVLGRTTKVINPDNTDVNINYDHWVTSVYDENNHRTDYVSDAYDNILEVKEYVGSDVYITKYEYDANGNLIKIRDNKGNDIRYAYDTLSRKTNLIDSDLGSWSYRYDNVGNLIEQTDAKGNIISMSYDELSRILSKSVSSFVINYVYDTDTISTLSRIESPIETTSYNYDNRLRKTRENKVIDGLTFITEWVYDSMDRVTTKTLSDGTTISYSYNNQGALESLSDIITSIDYNENSMVADRIYANSLSTILGYDPNNYRLSTVQTGNLQDMNYEYDNVGNILIISDSINNLQDFMDYDNRDQLVKAKRRDTSGSDIYSIDYLYDSIGNMLKIDHKDYQIQFSYDVGHGPKKIEITGDLTTDGDNDGIPDSLDDVIGDVQDVETNVPALTLLIGGSEDTSDSFDGEQKVNFNDDTGTILEFTVDFNQVNLNLNNIIIKKQEAGSDKSSLVISGLQLPDGQTKTVYVDRINSDADGVCVKDAEISSINEITGDCTGSGEVYLPCHNSLEISGYKCIEENGKYKVTGLKHSGIVESDVDDDNDGVRNANDQCPSTPTTETANSDGCSCSQITIPLRDCPDSGCQGSNYVTYPADGYDTCVDGTITEQYSCNAISSEFNQNCYNNADDDRDGKKNSEDDCPNTPSGEGVNAQGCSCSQIDIPFRDCLADRCEGHNWVDYPDDSYDTCVGGEITAVHSCDSISSEFNQNCYDNADDDGDTIKNTNDNCPNTPQGETPNNQGCSCSQVTVDDNNDCTTDNCNNGVVTHLNKPAGTSCGSSRDCPIDNCIGNQWYNYPDDGHDSCNSNGQCLEYSCTATSSYSSDCDTDDDNDSITDDKDKCPNTPSGETVNTDGCSCSQLTIDDGNDCTSDSCENGIVTHANKPVGSTCGSNRDCQDDRCIGDQWYDYPTDGHDGCNANGQCVEYSCTASSSYNANCDNDDDGDSIIDDNDNCPNTPANKGVNSNGCSCSQITILFRDCPDSRCEGHNYVTYPVDGYDVCVNGEITEVYSCDAVSSVFNQDCYNNADDDGEGVRNADDNCANTPFGEGVNSDGCSCSQVTVDDGNDCTEDSCVNGVVTHSNKPAGTQCGSNRDCSDDTCIGEQWYDYPIDGSDSCNANGQCIEYSCTALSSSYSTDCDVDDDDDGIPDENDNCLNTPAGETPNNNGCSCSQVTIDDNNDCTTDSCESGIVTHANKPPGSTCGISRNCPDDGCIGDRWYNYPADGHDSCNSNGQCTEYSCTATTGYSSDCDTDDDNDNVADDKDKCPETRSGAVVDTNGCSCRQKNYCIDDDPCTVDSCDPATAECNNEYEDNRRYYILEKACCPNEDDCVGDEDECISSAEGVNTNRLCAENNELELCGSNDDKISSIGSQKYCCLNGKWNLGICGDFDNSGCVKFPDFIAFAQAYGKREGEDGYDIKYDLSNNNVIDFEDFVIFASGYGKCA